MTDHNGQPSDEIVGYYGDSKLLNKLFKGLHDKGFKADGLFGDKMPETDIKYLKIYPLCNHQMTAYFFMSIPPEDTTVEVTPDNIDTFINNLQP